MKTALTLIALLTVAAASPADYRLPITDYRPADNAQKEIKADYKKMDQLFGARDADGLAKFMQAHTTKTFYSTVNGQKFTLDQNMAQITPLLKQAISITRKPTVIHSITINGTQATAKLAGSFTAIVMGRDQKKHSMAGGGQATDHWVNQNGKWLIEETDSYDNTFTIDGHSMQQPAKPK